MSTTSKYFRKPSADPEDTEKTSSSKGRRRKAVKVEYETDEDKDVPVVAASASGPKQSSSVSKKKKAMTPSPQTSDESEKSDSKPVGVAPENWQEVLKNIRTMRSLKNAPVDTMGCERTMEVGVDEKVRRYQTLISLMLSSQTKDEVTFAAMSRLKDNGLQPKIIQQMDESKLQDIIKPVGFYRRKAEYIKKTTDILLNEYDGDIPKTIEDLLKLPGVGPKMGYICLNVAWGQNAGIGVDTHVHRISDRLGWSSSIGKKNPKNSTPEDTRKALESWLPRDLWQEVNILLVGFGQTICVPTNPKCGECLNNNLCPVGKAAMKKKPKK